MHAGIGAVPMSAFQAAYGRRNVTVTVLPDTATLLMSSQPSRDVMSNDWFISVCQRNRKSAPVIGLPSLHFAAFLYEKRTVSGFAFSIFG